MATLAQLRTRMDDFLTAKWPTFVARQENYFTNKGRYWQGLLTHSVIPANTNSTTGDSIADRIAIHPTDQFEDWITAFPEFATEAIPCALKVDTYSGPAGVGYVATLFVRYAGVLYSRSQNVGPESWRTKAWAVVDESPTI